MKYPKLLILALLTILLIGCNKDDSETTPDPPLLTLKGYTFKRYDTSNSPNLVRDSTHYQLENNRIISSTGVHQITTSPKNSDGDFLYENGKISETNSFREGIKVRTTKFSYDSNGNLLTYSSQELNTQFQETVYHRHRFTHTNDTIYATWERSDDGVNYDTILAESKMILDANNNRTYYEAFDVVNNDTKRTISTYDANNNLMIEDSAFLSNNTWVPSLRNTYAYEQSTNTFAMINEATYGRQTLMMLYHLQGNSLNNFNPKNISPNSLNQFETTFSDTVVFEINNTLEANNSISNEFKTLFDGVLFSRFTLDYTFE